MKIKILFLIFTFPLLNGCLYRHVDSITQFLIKGEAVDKTSGLSVDKVRVAFIDTGFDSVRSKEQVPKEIGESDSLGRINLAFDYWWGTEQGLFKKKARMTFDLEFSREHYKSERFHFSASNLIKEENKLLVPLNKIFLEPNQEQSKSR